MSNGISCMSCHNRGVIPKADQVRRLLDDTHPFTDKEAAAIKAHYPPPEKFAELLDSRRCAAGLSACPAAAQVSSAAAVISALWK